MTLPLFLDPVTSFAVYDLAHEYFRGMPVSPNHPDFDMSLKRRHGDIRRADGGSSANELIVTGGHVGTHVDALAHISHNGKLHDGVVATNVQGHEGFTRHGAEQIDAFVGRGVLLDVARTAGVEILPPAYEVTADDLDDAEKLAGAEVGRGDAVVIRTGWSRKWATDDFTGRRAGAPGPGPSAAEWLVERGVRFAGGETIAFEVIRPETGHTVLPVHRRLLVDAGVHIVEAMNLGPLESANVFEFLFVLAPLRIRGATGAPVRPLAITRES